VTLEERAETWIQPFWNAEHLRRTRDWLLELEPDASEALRLAALTHDMERHFPDGSPHQNLGLPPEGDMEYRRLHSERSAAIVGDWLRGEGADEELVTEVERLIRAHEVGGAPDEDLIQSADSISFIEVNVDLPMRWAAEGRSSFERGVDQHRWMYERIRVPRARELARPLYERILSLAA
jgi:hypothetical protein